MITIIHGDDIASSRSFYQEAKSKQKDPLSYGALSLKVSDLAQNLQGTGLFNDTKIIFIEEFFSKLKKTSKEAKEIIEFINTNSKSANIYFWESKEIPKRDLFVFKDAILKSFKLPRNIFLFLDNLRPNNSKSLLISFHTALHSGIKEELILFMLQRQFRLLLSLSDENSSEQIDEVNRLAPWQRGKLERQAKYFSVESLKQIYKKFFEIELGQKTGRLPLTLTQSIDFFLLEI